MILTNIIILMTVAILAGCETENNQWSRLIKEGDVVYHKLTNEKCVVRESNSPYENTYNCVMADGSIKKIYQSEYSLEPVNLEVKNDN
jgi:hypothetical protein